MEMEMEMEMMNDRLSPYHVYRYLTKVHSISWIQLDRTVPNNNSTAKNGEEGMVMTTTTTTCTRRCWDEIPTDILVKILSGMSMRRLVQYRGISKTWFNTITHHMDPNLLPANYQEPGCVVIHSSPGCSTRLSFNVRQGGVKPKSIDYAPFDILFSRESSFESSCNGLICLKQYSSSLGCIRSRSSRPTAKYSIIVCNPYILEATTLPNIINNNNSFSSLLPRKHQQQHHDEQQNRQQQPLKYFKENYGLGFSPSTNQYKVVRVTWFDEDHLDMIHHVSYRKNKQNGSIDTITRLRQPEKIQILTLGTTTTSTTTNINSSYKGMINNTNSWRDVSSVPPLPIYGAPVYANGSLHWKVDTRYFKILNYFKDFCIISFDIGKEEFHVISQPPFVKKLCSNTGNIDLINWRGSLAMVKYEGGHLGTEGHLHIWVLQLNNKNNKQQQQQWIREYTIETGRWGRAKVIGLWEHGEILCYFNSSSPSILMSYDLKTSKMRRIHVRSGFDPMSKYRHDLQGHTWSLVSLKAYGCKTWRTAPGIICSNLYDRDNMLTLLSKEERVDPTTVQLLTELPTSWLRIPPS